MKTFSEWLVEREQRQDEVWGTLGALAKTGVEFASQMAGIPTGTELGLDTSPVKAAAKTAWMAYGDKFKPMTPEQIAAHKDACFNKGDYTACKTLCDKIRNKKACSKVGVGKIGRRWGVTNPFMTRG